MRLQIRMTWKTWPTPNFQGQPDRWTATKCSKTVLRWLSHIRRARVTRLGIDCGRTPNCRQLAWRGLGLLGLCNEGHRSGASSGEGRAALEMPSSGNAFGEKPPYRRRRESCRAARRRFRRSSFAAASCASHIVSCSPFCFVIWASEPFAAPAVGLKQVVQVVIAVLTAQASSFDALFHCTEAGVK
jgi:hypothetical protein